ncbi:MAG: biotin--[acetyl-CoA-carboxylase] ligase [Holosporaceae bacterium]|nr:biotin--[acetyl-CoA-carboxylase] ligase [Holosporaceae bacterium]
MQGKVIKFKTIDSTHKFAVRLIEKGKATECSIIAEKQTDGIGRCGRAWESPRGNLFASIIKKSSSNSELTKLSLMIACAVHEAISHYIPDNLYLHWPNDIYYKKSKVAGMLTTVIDCWLVISAGVNVNSAPEVANAASIKDVCGGVAVPPDEVLEKILVALDKWFDNFNVLGFLYIKNYWLRYINEIDCKITIRNGLDSLTGVFRGIDDSGRLILEMDGRRLFISSGDMFSNMEGMVTYHE